MVNLGRRWYTRNYEILEWLESQWLGPQDQREWKAFRMFGHMVVYFKREEDRTFFQLNWV
jgi:hypothetical protein